MVGSSEPWTPVLLGLTLGPPPTSLSGLPFAGPLPRTHPTPFSLAAKKPDLSPELRKIFQQAVKDVGMDESEIVFVDWTKVSDEAA